MKGWIYIFDEKGLRFSLEHLQRAFRSAKQMPVDQLAQYVDEVTFRQLPEADQLPDRLPHGISMTSVGNLAFTLLYTGDPQVKNKCAILLEQFKKS